MSRKKPVELHVLQGSYKKNPQRKPKNIPKSNLPLGEPPKDFTDLEKELWAELQVMSALFSTVADRWIAEQACRLMAKSRENTITDAQRTQLLKCISTMGLTPTDRPRLMATNKPESDNEFGEFDKVANAA